MLVVDVLNTVPSLWTCNRRATLNKGRPSWSTIRTRLNTVKADSLRDVTLRTEVTTPSGVLIDCVFDCCWRDWLFDCSINWLSDEHWAPAGCTVNDGFERLSGRVVARMRRTVVVDWSSTLDHCCLTTVPLAVRWTSCWIGCLATWLFDWLFDGLFGESYVDSTRLTFDWSTEAWFCIQFLDVSQIHWTYVMIKLAIQRMNYATNDKRRQCFLLL